MSREKNLDENSLVADAWGAKQKRAYYRQRRKAKKTLIKASKRYHPWDYGYLLDFIRIILNDMHDYYSIGTAVMQVDESRKMIVSQIEETLAKMDEYQDAEDNIDDDVDDLLADFFALLGKYLPSWWD